MALLSLLPHGFLVVVIVVVAFFLLKALIKFAIVVGLVGLAIYLLWVLGVFGKAKASFLLPHPLG